MHFVHKRERTLNPGLTILKILNGFEFRLKHYLNPQLCEESDGIALSKKHFLEKPILE